MTLPELALPRRRALPRWLRPAFGIASFLFGVALANALILTLITPLASHAAPLTILIGFAAIFFALAALQYFLTRPATLGDRMKTAAWAEQRYNLHLNDKQLRQMTKPAVGRNLPFPGWTGMPTVHLQPDTNGHHTLLHLILTEIDGQYLIFAPEAGGEYPTNPNLLMQENQDFMEEAWTEIDEHGGVYILTPTQDYFTGEIVRARVPGGPDVALIWSDKLRADLWLGEETEHKDSDWQVTYLTLPDMYNQILPAMIRENQSIGLNWGDGTRAYDATWFTAKMSQRFNWLSS